MTFVLILLILKTTLYDVKNKINEYYTRIFTFFIFRAWVRFVASKSDPSLKSALIKSKERNFVLFLKLSSDLMLLIGF